MTIIDLEEQRKRLQEESQTQQLRKIQKNNIEENIDNLPFTKKLIVTSSLCKSISEFFYDVSCAIDDATDKLRKNVNNVRKYIQNGD